MVVIGVLALQGDYEAHARAIVRAGGEACEVRTAEELQAVDGLIIPGGESTTMLKLLDRENLFEPLRAFGNAKPVFGTCAGAILLAREVSNPKQNSLGLVDIAVERNAYGRQLDSRVTSIEGENLGAMEAVFIRAPIIRRAGAGVKVIASYNGDPVLVEQGRHLVATFHPELSSDNLVHKYFLDKVAAQ
ncbi:MAG: pyridoxal 5'-phosphate synthase glutaminase subunit PdxT [Acidobacteria bacterium]|nr:pyridoxal 5'-phosphate synthase glutaminase subunit PdxT [Acidobacteriota bacterium]